MPQTASNGIYARKSGSFARAPCYVLFFKYFTAAYVSFYRLFLSPNRTHWIIGVAALLMHLWRLSGQAA